VEPEQTYIRGLQPALRELGLLDTEAGRAALGIWFFDGAEHLIEGFAGCLDALQALSRHYKLGVITNGPDAIQAKKFEALKVGAHFAPELFVTSERAGCFKPDERIFRRALELAGVEAGEAIHIGDSLEADVAGAHGAGMLAVWFNPDGREPERGIVPDATVSSYAELPALIEKWSG
jgi:FMN hydrolase / 5-amino-6-(5-phospho-D-ribitylamino)uracil phosphatase